MIETWIRKKNIKHQIPTVFLEILSVKKYFNNKNMKLKKKNPVKHFAEGSTKVLQLGCISFALECTSRKDNSSLMLRSTS